MLKKAVRLHMNEMPHPPDQRVIEATRRAVAILHHYADPEALQRLRQDLADYSGVPARHVIVSPGSDLLLREMVHAFSPGRKVIMVDPSFLPTVQTADQFTPRHLSLRLRPPTFDLNRELLQIYSNEVNS